jgi:hypothetical protein
MDVHIPLADLNIDLMKEATKDKTVWARKVPLKLVFQRASLPYSEPAFVMFAENAAEKEQWYFALSWGADFCKPRSLDRHGGFHSDGLHAQNMYQQFSTYMRRVAPVIIPVVLAPAPAVAAVGGPGTAAEPRRRWWGGRRNRAQGGTTSRTVSMNSSFPPMGTNCQVVGDFISDKQWGSGAPKTAKIKGKGNLHMQSRSAQSLTAMLSTPMSPPPGAPLLATAACTALHPRIVSAWQRCSQCSGFSVSCEERF